VAASSATFELPITHVMRAGALPLPYYQFPQLYPVVCSTQTVVNPSAIRDGTFIPSPRTPDVCPHQHITQPTSRPHVASPTWSSTEQVARPATKRFHPSDWRALEACCRPWTWWCNDATALAGYATTMNVMMTSVPLREITVGYVSPN